MLYTIFAVGRKIQHICCLANSSGVTHSCHLTGQSGKIFWNIIYRLAMNFGLTEVIVVSYTNLPVYDRGSNAMHGECTIFSAKRIACKQQLDI